MYWYNFENEQVSLRAGQHSLTYRAPCSPTTTPRQRIFFTDQTKGATTTSNHEFFYENRTDFATVCPI